MVTLNRAAYQSQPRNSDFYGKSTDNKPVYNIRNGDIFYEFDTQKVYMFDEETKSWIEQ